MTMRPVTGGPAVRVTVDIYASVMPGMDAEAAERLAALVATR